MHNVCPITLLLLSKPVSILDLRTDYVEQHNLMTTLILQYQLSLDIRTSKQIMLHNSAPFLFWNNCIAQGTNGCSSLLGNLPQNKTQTNDVHVKVFQ